MPSRLRHRIDAMRTATVSVPGTGPTVDSAVLGAIAGAIRASERLRFTYVDYQGNQTVRRAELSGSWYGAADGICSLGTLIGMTGAYSEWTESDPDAEWSPIQAADPD